MATINDGGAAAKKCSRCEEPASHKQGHQHLCQMHYRFGQMRALAKRRGLAVPSHEQLANLVSHTGGLKCMDCKRQMQWLAREGQATVASLQHYRSGSFGLVCRSCNTRHAAQEGDTFCLIPSTHKRCPGCDTIKHLDEFGTDNLGRFANKQTYCRPCRDAKVTKWKRGNRERCNQYQREYRAKRKEEGNPVASGT